MNEKRDFLMDALEYDDALAHYGTEGMEWGKRRYQYEDGSLTPLGRIHYGIGKRREKKAIRKARKIEKKEEKRADKVEKLARAADVDTILKNSKLFTKEELEDALGRAKLREDAHYKSGRRALYREEMSKERKSATEKYEQAYKRVNAIRSAAVALTGIYTAYNVIAKDVNEITGEKTLPRFDQESFKNWKSGKDKTGFDTSKSTVFKDSTDYHDTHGSMFGYSDDELKGMQTYSFPEEKEGKKSSSKKEKQPKWEQVKSSPFDQQTSSSSRTSDDVINMYFDAVTGSYGADRTDWASAMNTKLKAIEMDFTPGVRKKR